jgi:hypothetical protein
VWAIPSNGEKKFQQQEFAEPLSFRTGCKILLPLPYAGLMIDTVAISNGNPDKIP